MTTWMETYQASIAEVEAHPRFRQLVREVAVAEQSHMPGSHRLRRNSLSHGMWVTRGMPHINKGRRAQLLARQISVELWGDQDEGTTQFREREAKVYVAARVYVQGRTLPAMVTVGKETDGQ